MIERYRKGKRTAAEVTVSRIRVVEFSLSFFVNFLPLRSRFGRDEYFTVRMYVRMPVARTSFQDMKSREVC